MATPVCFCGRARKAAALVLLLALAGALSPAAVRAHVTQLSSSRITLAAPQADIAVEINAADLAAALALPLLDAQGRADPRALTAGSQQIAAYVTAHARVLGPTGHACTARWSGLAAKAEHVVASLHWRCPPGNGVLSYRVTLFHEIDAASRHIVVTRGDSTRMALLSVNTPGTALTEVRSGAVELFMHYLLAGVAHIAIGYDHVAFLIAVVVWGRALWPLIKVVTAFTVAHSLTLALAVAGIVQPAAAPVEIAIALSIVYVAAENFFVHDLRRRTAVTFLFGLVHGFGFAGVLRDYGLPADALPATLAAFNLGVEIGQVAIVLAAVLVFAVTSCVLRPFKLGRRMLAWMPFALSGIILVLGLYWAVERTSPFLHGS